MSKHAAADLGQRAQTLAPAAENGGRREQRVECRQLPSPPPAIGGLQTLAPPPTPNDRGALTFPGQPPLKTYCLQGPDGRGRRSLPGLEPGKLPGPPPRSPTAPRPPRTQHAPPRLAAERRPAGAVSHTRQPLGNGTERNFGLLRQPGDERLTSFPLHGEKKRPPRRALCLSAFPRRSLAAAPGRATRGRFGAPSEGNFLRAGARGPLQRGAAPRTGGTGRRSLC